MGKTILLVSPHADDVEIGIGMRAAQYSREGHKTYELVLSKGELGGDPNQRMREAEESAKILGITDLIMKEHPNCKFDSNSDGIFQSIEKTVSKLKPDTIYLPWKDDTHVDHAVTYNRGIHAARSAHDVILYQCLTSKGFIPNSFFYGGKELMGTKLKAISSNKSQLERGAISLDQMETEGKYWANRSIHHSGLKTIKEKMGLDPNDQIYAEPFIIERKINF